MENQAEPTADSQAPSPGSTAVGASTVSGAAQHSIYLRLELHCMSGLLSVLTTTSRIGATLIFVRAGDGLVDLGVAAPERIARRVAPLLEQLVDVTHVSALPGGPRRSVHAPHLSQPALG